ncbi:MAG TPA: YhbY family RNA-binding protein [Burkholderiales bacterium]|nr:YhbY family RNA-binding protein [Burkholderiales bacterium]
MLSPAQRKELKARAHNLDPVVMIGAKGLTDEVVKEVELALKSHELIKVRAPSLDRSAREVAYQALCERTAAEGVQHIGKIFVLYRKRDVEAG